MSSNRIIVGCCGYRYYRPPKNWKQKYKQKIQAYADKYSLIEINSTFYKLPKASTAKKWKKLVDKINEDFIFTLKANQRITHPPGPTYRKAKLEIPEEEKGKYGFFRSTEQVFQAWKETKEICNALQAEVCLFQCPASFKPTKENLENAENFFSQVNDLNLAFEPRGSRWTQKMVKNICKKYQIIHTVDPFKQKPAYLTSLAYFRLHGLGKRKYKYKFSNKDLKKLYQTCKNHEGKKIYVLFNNYQMFSDAKRFLTYLDTGKLPRVSWGAEAIADTIDIKYPTTKQKILDKCGNWWCWIRPDKSIRIKQALKHVEKERFENRKELLKSVEEAYKKI